MIPFDFFHFAYDYALMGACSFSIRIPVSPGHPVRSQQCDLREYIPYDAIALPSTRLLSPANLLNYLFPGFVVMNIFDRVGQFLIFAGTTRFDSRVSCISIIQFSPPSYRIVVVQGQFVVESSIIIAYDSLSNLFAPKVIFKVVDPLPFSIME